MPATQITKFAYKFQELVGELFEALGYHVEREVFLTGIGIREVDILAHKDGELTKAIEVKWTHRPDVYLRVLRQWAPAAARLKAENVEAVLVASGFVEQSRRDWAESEFGIKIWDRSDILRASSGFPLQAALVKYFKESDDIVFGSMHRITDSSAIAENTEEVNDTALEDLPLETQGEILIKRLEDINSGNDGAKVYENLCEEIVNYLFGDSLTDPRKQARLDDGLSIIDIVYRVKSHSLFWAALARDFRARVIVFECKNYAGPVGPMQVFTTERYMSTVALRPVCFVLSRTTAHEHAKMAAQGAMRETGKMIIFLGDEIVKKMLRLRDAQIIGGEEAWLSNDPTEVLDQEIYDFLATMPR